MKTSALNEFHIITSSDVPAIKISNKLVFSFSAFTHWS